ncbi:MULTISPECIES: riboflavin synthase [unclassified Novosphingobium]|uniref:riboflavin synthase n=1 Tax=unclassified Novosphingobium TaxID=2644732 RepID=UPI00145C12D9|nr:MULTISPECIES: riboflavin synthase [unclassified Novosphingobium]MBB3359599.1 riboflavin synthase [Novosphingobium sp. BK256]MBB3376035.1 riboflavin synthase [Novosphingobium sp. BK280]MBB3380372.1 riboflavin synthase [Novosphingobium sp. BK258]MBB3422024.1 riboflavin synthase [Novosphingobium sp. BK267]MBB3450799.1 riboflavin synthase [Novosphingobium sp. BK352]
MFTGIVTEVGNVIAIADKGDKRVTISCAMDPARIAIGASIACSGVCLTVVEKGGVAGEAWFAVDVSGETVSRTAPAQWQAGAPINLEPALRLGDELGGHIVTGHVDALGEIASITPEGGSLRVIIAAPPALAPYIAPKGSITVDGVSLTVNEVADQSDGTCHFALNIIPHTAQITTLGQFAPGRQVNLEIDVLARYLQRMQSLSRQA